MIPSPGDLVERILEYLLHSHVHDMGEHPSLGIASALSRRAGQLEDITLRNQRLEGRAEALLQPLGIMLSHLQPVDNVGCDVTSSAGQRSGMADLAAVKDRHVGGAA